MDGAAEQDRPTRTDRPIMVLLDLLGRRWALRVLWELRGGPVPTFRALQEACGGISSSVLAQRLAELGDAGILQRTDGGYRLTAEGARLVDVLLQMNAWADRWAGHRPPTGPR